MSRGGIVCVAAALLVAGCGGAPLFAGQRIERSSQLVDFALHDQDGRVVSLSSLRGRYVVVSFLYTRCADVCPLIAEKVGAVLRVLGPAAPVSAIAVSVDPQGDTRSAVAAFLREHRTPPSFRYLVGSRVELAPIWQEFNVLVESRTAVRIAHDAPVYVVDPDGRPALMYGSNVTAAQLEHDLRRLTG